MNTKNKIKKRILFFSLFFIACMLLMKIYDIRTFKTRARYLVKEIEVTCGNEFMDCIDYVYGMRQPREYKESKDSCSFTIKLVVKNGCEDKVLDLLKERTNIVYEKEGDVLENSEITDAGIIPFSINGEWNDILTRDIIFHSTIEKSDTYYNYCTVDLYGVKPHSSTLEIYCTTKAINTLDNRIKVIKYLYLSGSGNLNHFVIFSLIMTITILLAYLIISILHNLFWVRKKSIDKVDRNKILLLSGLIFVIGIAFFLNMVMNFPRCFYIPFYYHYRPNCVATKHIGIWKLINYASYCKISNSELVRSVFEMLSFVPIGMLLYKIFGKRKVFKSIVFITCVSVSFELFGDWGSISYFYYQTLFYNVLGGLIGISIIRLIVESRNGLLIRKRDKAILFIPILLSIVIFGFSYILGNTNILSSVYPDYYNKIDSSNLNVKLNNERCINTPVILNKALSEEQYQIYYDMLNIEKDADYEDFYEKSDIENVYFTNQEMQEMLDAIGIDSRGYDCGRIVCGNIAFFHAMMRFLMEYMRM